MHKDQGRYEKSEECLQHAVAIYEQSDPRGIDLALTINSLGRTYGMQGRYSEAEAMFERALDLIEKSVGSTNPYWTDITKNLALVYQNEGRHEEAEQLLKRIPDRQ
jgi:tetratricopeptide (TPR) repeat protein